MNALGIDFSDPLVWDALGIIVGIIALAALAPPFDSTDDKHWGDGPRE